MLSKQAIFSSQPLLSLEVSHQYYYQATAQGFCEWMLSPSSQETLPRWGVYAQKKGSKLLLFIRDDREAAFTQWLASKEESRLAIQLKALNPHWLHITELPLTIQPGQGILYFHNPASPGSYSKQMDSPQYLKVVPIQSLPAQTLKQLMHQTPPGEAFKLPGDNTSYPQVQEGAYTLPSPEPTNPSYLLLHRPLPPKRFAWIDLVLHPYMKESWAQDIKAGTPPQTFSYQIRFPNRKAYWRYWFIMAPHRPLQSIQDLTIYSEDSRLAFSEKKPYRHKSGNWAWVLESNQALDLYEKPPYRVQVDITWNPQYRSQEAQYAGRRSDTMSIPLPVPRPESLYPETQQNETRLYADIPVKIP